MTVDGWYRLTVDVYEQHTQLTILPCNLTILPNRGMGPREALSNYFDLLYTNTVFYLLGPTA